MSNHLTGIQIPKDKLKNYLGKRIIYLFRKDIDRSARGYYFPRIGTITLINGRQIDFGDREDPQSLSLLSEAVEATEESIKANFK